MQTRRIWLLCAAGALIGLAVAGANDKPLLRGAGVDTTGVDTISATGVTGATGTADAATSAFNLTRFKMLPWGGQQHRHAMGMQQLGGGWGMRAGPMAMAHQMAPAQYPPLTKGTKLKDIDPQKTSEYEVVKKLGEGAYGQAYLVNWKSDAHPDELVKLVVKRIPDKATYKSESEISEVVYGIKFVAKVVGELHAMVGRTVQDFLVMEHYAEGDMGSLKESLTVQEKRTLFSQVLQALKQVHELNIIHRDVKTDNVFISRNEQGNVQAHLGDFGIARQVKIDRSPVGGRVAVLRDARSYAPLDIMTAAPGYLPPEVHNNHFISAPISAFDIWGVGMSMVQMFYLDGRPQDFLTLADRRAMHYAPLLVQWWPQCSRRLDTLAQANKGRLSKAGMTDEGQQQLLEAIKAMLTKPAEERPSDDDALALPFFTSDI